MKKLVFTAVLLTLGCLTAAAAADETPGRADRRRPVVLDTVKIVGRGRPIAAVDVARARPQLGVSELKRSLVDRIEQPTGRDPF